MKILDAHCHIFPDKIADKASMSIGNFYDLEMSKDGRLETMLKEGKKAGITHYLVHSVATSPKQVSSINNFISETVKNSNGTMTGFGAMHPESSDLRADLKELMELGLRGVKLHPDIQGYKADDYRMLKIYELCEEYSLPVLIHCGDKRYDNSNPNRIAPILETYDKLTVIGAHFGGYSVWQDAVKRLAGYDNFYVDTSSSLFMLSEKETESLIDAYGEDRVLFGTDFPMWNATDEVTRFFNLNLTEKQKQKILWENGAKLLGLPM